MDYFLRHTLRCGRHEPPKSKDFADFLSADGDLFPSSDLTWRFDPIESHSDWKIEIVVEGSLKGRVYHVHKSVLAVGHKASAYFARLFKNKICLAANTSTSQIVLKKEAAVAFPTMLDFIYSHDDRLKINTESATALHYLGQCFEVSSLRRKVLKFVHQDMTVENCGVYYEHAKFFYDVTIIKAVVTTCCADIDFITLDSIIFKVSDDRLWLSVLPRLNGYDSLGSYCWLIAEFCNIHRDVIEKDTFLSLTDEKFLPVIAVEAAAWLFLELEPFILESDLDPNKLSSLQARCIDILAKSWVNNLKDFSADRLVKLGPLVLSNLLKGTAGNAKAQLESDRNAAQTKISSIEAALNTAEAALNKLSCKSEPKRKSSAKDKLLDNERPNERKQKQNSRSFLGTILHAVLMIANCQHQQQTMTCGTPEALSQYTRTARRWYFGLSTFAADHGCKNASARSDSRRTARRWYSGLSTCAVDHGCNASAGSDTNLQSYGVDHGCTASAGSDTNLQSYQTAGPPDDWSEVY